MKVLFLKLMAEYGGTVLWHFDSSAVGPVDPDELPLSDDLKKQLDDWAKTYDRTLNASSPSDSGFESSEEENAFEAEGLRLFHALKTELPETTRVVYFSEKRGKLVE
jgi:hypothetical protein